MISTRINGRPPGLSQVHTAPATPLRAAAPFGALAQARPLPQPAAPRPAAPPEMANALKELLQGLASLLQALLQKASGAMGAEGAASSGSPAVGDGSSAETGADASAVQDGSSGASVQEGSSPQEVQSGSSPSTESPAPAPAPSPPPPNPMEQMMLMRAMGMDPLAFDLSGEGIRTTGQRASFDLDADGQKDNLAEVNAGMLAIRGGKDGRDLLGNYTDLDGDGRNDGHKDGFDALEALARKEGLVDGRGDMKLSARDLAFLEQKYDLGMKQGYGGEKKSLREVGVTEIDLSQGQRRSQRLDAEGNTAVHRDGATFKVNGQTRNYADVWSVKG
jgi:hypothetical protein